MPIATLNRTQLQKISEDRRRDAEILLNALQFTGAYYMAGLAMECGLKAYLASKVKEHDFPDKSYVNSAYTHNLEQLATLDAELWQQLKSDIDQDPDLHENWRIVKSWDESRRYAFVSNTTAENFCRAVAGTNGILDWLRRRW